MASVDVFEAVGEPGRCQGTWSQPAARVGEATDIDRGDAGHRSHAQQCAPSCHCVGTGAGGLDIGPRVVLLATITGLHADRPSAFVQARRPGWDTNSVEAIHAWANAKRNFWRGRRTHSQDVAPGPFVHSFWVWFAACHTIE
ncbi:hypothetical protein GCM10023161_14130 [Mycobacterium paraffinicum]|uniref:Transposase n=1 Tax=Mycobacterium paraffinicum TaxID=53378 RepID=A0ABP8RG56_9MYCO